MRLGVKDTGQPAVSWQWSRQVGEIRVVKVEMVRTSLDLFFEGRAKRVCL